MELMHFSHEFPSALCETGLKFHFQLFTHLGFFSCKPSVSTLRLNDVPIVKLICWVLPISDTHRRRSLVGKCGTSSWVLDSVCCLLPCFWC
ncbi:hypothetical protein KP509_31G049200 [Ceratopteris richardii]|uniref:Uncharacterized protein n=1 Tax=Ceratopteris richardii TaxID=49495 RepID=A0A8T2QYH7_CERRI|nr:hypothetical protein KP509_31G049200 [Ceratopteris richardii]